VDISRLRLETANDHQEAEKGMHLMHLDVDAADYLRCLSRVYGILAPWEEQAFVAAPEWLRASLSLRKRRHMLDSDFATWGALPTPDRATLPPFDDVYSMLGAMYVMEGSTLGGQVISRHVEKCLGLVAGNGDAFFLGHGDQTGRMWKEFCSLLETKVPEDRSDSVILGAKAMFRCFREWMSRTPAPSAS
jgi:heme oxygenase (biliverdin-IX-beta and delta-forming)